jgi:hypothetical protein
MKRKRFSKAKGRPKRPGRIVTRMGKKWSKDPAPFWHKSELQIGFRSESELPITYLDGAFRNVYVSKTRPESENLFSFWGSTGLTWIWQIVTRMLVTPIHPLFNVKRNPSPEPGPSSEFESEKTKLVLRSCFLFLYHVKLRIPTARQAVGI